MTCVKTTLQSFHLVSNSCSHPTGRPMRSGDLPAEATFVVIDCPLPQYPLFRVVWKWVLFFTRFSSPAGDSMAYDFCCIMFSSTGKSRLVTTTIYHQYSRIIGTNILTNCLDSFEFSHSQSIAVDSDSILNWLYKVYPQYSLRINRTCF